MKSGDYTVLMVGDDSKKYKTKFKNFINSKSFFAGDGYKYIVTDELSKNYLGLSDKEKGKVFVLIKKHSNVLVPSNEVVSIDGDCFYVYNSEEITNKLIFPPFI